MERTDDVRIRLAREIVAISSADRNELLDRVRRDGWIAVAAQFRGAGPGGDVRLDLGAKSIVLGVVSAWVGEVGRDRAPPGIVNLQEALLDERRSGGLR